MFAALALETQRLISTYIDRVQAYWLHHVSKPIFALLHGPILYWDRQWAIWEMRQMRDAEWISEDSEDYSDEDSEDQ